MKATAQRQMFEVTREDWTTPPEVFAALDAEFGFTLDPCSSDENALCAKHYTLAENGLGQPWAPEVVYMNPPYGREIGAWVRKGYEESQLGATVVCLIPSRTDTSWWHEYVMAADEIRFVRGRLRFGGRRENSAPFPSVVVVFRPFVGNHNLGLVDWARLLLTPVSDNSRGLAQPGTDYQSLPNAVLSLGDPTQPPSGGGSE